MTLFWAQVTLFLLGTALHVIGRAYETAARQHLHYLERWDAEVAQALEEAVVWTHAWEPKKADEAITKLRLINRQYVLFFDSLS